MKRRGPWLALLGFSVLLSAYAGTMLASIDNRSGPPESTLRLSERELELPTGDPSGDEDNTPLTLHLVWRIEANELGPSGRAASTTRAAWITRSTLERLRVDLPRRAGPDTYVSTFLVLEFDGPSHARAVSQACNPVGAAHDARLCEIETKQSSRLYVVDAGRTIAELRQRYPGRDHFAIVPGVIKLSTESNTGEVAGFIESLSVDTVQGVEPLRSTIDPASGKMLWRRLLARQDFDAVIRFGRRLEPWNISIEARKGVAAGAEVRRR